MAKKKPTTAKSSPAKKSAKRSACKSAEKKKSPPVGHDHDQEDCCGDEDEIELDETERAAIDHFVESEKARDALEHEVNAVVTQAVRKICKTYGKPLTAAQAQNVAMVLFGD